MRPFQVTCLNAPRLESAGLQALKNRPYPMERLPEELLGRVFAWVPKGERHVI